MRPGKAVRKDAEEKRKTKTQVLVRADKLDQRIKEGWKVVEVHNSNLDERMKKNLKHWDDLVLIEKEI